MNVVDIKCNDLFMLSFISVGQIVPAVGISPKHEEKRRRGRGHNNISSSCRHMRQS